MAAADAGKLGSPRAKAWATNDDTPTRRPEAPAFTSHGLAAAASSKKADALVVSCGALRTLELIVPLESQIKVPVVSSTPHGLMNGVRLLGVSPRARGYGMVLAKA